MSAFDDVADGDDEDNGPSAGSLDDSGNPEGFSDGLDKGDEGGEDGGDKKVGEEISGSREDLAETVLTYTDLPSEKKAIALMGFKNPHGVRIGNVVTISFPTDPVKKNAVQEFLKKMEGKGLISELSPNSSVVADGDGLMAVQYLVPVRMNARVLHMEALSECSDEREKLPMKITVSKSKSRVLRIGSTLVAVDPFFKSGEFDPGNKDFTSTPAFESEETALYGEMDAPEAERFTSSYPSVTAKSLCEASTTLSSEPRPGPCSCLTIKLTGLSDREVGELVKILWTLTEFKVSDDEDEDEEGVKKYHVSGDSAGNLVVFGLGERPAGILAELVIKIKSRAPGVDVALSDGEIEAGEGLVVKDYVDLVKFGKASGGGKVHIPFRNLQDVKQRSSTDVDFVVVDEEGVEAGRYGPTDLVEVKIEYKEKPWTLHLGPREWIGATGDVEALRYGLSPESTTKWVRVLAAAGIGKSRMVSEVLKDWPSANIIYCRIDDSTSNQLGGSLIRLVESVTRAMENRRQTLSYSSRESFDGVTDQLLKFVRLSEDQKFKRVRSQEGAERIVALCKEAMSLFAKNAVNTELYPPVLDGDDLPFADRLSAPSIIEIMKDFPGKIVTPERLFKRQGAMMHPQLDALEAYYGGGDDAEDGAEDYRVEGDDNPVVRIFLQNEDGSPKLDLGDFRYADRYVWTSFPETESFSGPVNIEGDWPRKMGEGRTGLEMDSMINILRRHVITEGEKLTLSDEGFTELRTMAASPDLKRFLANRLSGNEVTPHERGFLGFLSWCGDSVPLDELIRVYEEYTGESGHVTLEGLTEKALVVVSRELFDAEGARMDCVSFLHPAMGEAVRAEMSSEESARKAEFLLDSLGEVLPISVKSELLRHITRTCDDGDNRWSQYSEVLDVIFDSARVDNDYRCLFETAMSVLGDEGMTRHIRLILDNGVLPENNAIIDILVESLKEVIISGFYRGQFEKVYDAMDLLEKLDVIYEDGDVFGEDVWKGLYLHAFNAAYVHAHPAFVMEEGEDSEDGTEAGEQKRVSRVEKYRGALEEQFSLDALEKLMLKIQATYKGEGAAACRAIIDGQEGQALIEELGEEPNGKSVRLRRLVYRVELEEVIATMAGSGMDEDVMPVCPQTLDRGNVEKLILLRIKLDRLAGDCENCRDGLSVGEALSLEEMRAQVDEYLCKFEDALDRLGKKWFLSSQTGIYHEAARAVHLQVELLTSMSLVGRVKRFPAADLPGHVNSIGNDSIIRRDHLRRARDILRNQGAHTLERLPTSDPEHIMIKAEPIRIALLMLQSYAAREVEDAPRLNPADVAEVKAEVLEFIFDGVKSLIDVDGMVDDVFGSADNIPSVFAYYVASNSFSLAKLVSVLGLEKDLDPRIAGLGVDGVSTVKDLWKLGIMSEDVAEKGLSYMSESVTAADPFGESERKHRGLKTGKARENRTFAETS